MISRLFLSLGKLPAISKSLPIEAVLLTMKEKLAGKPALLPLNEAAIGAGVRWVSEKR